MEYTDYKTGKPCTREQYIQNGLERGTLLYKYACGCIIIQDRTADAYIIYCSKHEAAPDMYEKLGTIKRTAESSVESFVRDADYLRNDLRMLARIAGEALAKAEGSD